VNWLKVKLLEPKIVCVKCGSVRTDGLRKSSEELCARCEAARVEDSPYVWIGRGLVRRSEVG
jgi:hypothetical protein